VVIVGGCGDIPQVGGHHRWWLVLGSPVPRLKKDWDWTGPRLPKTVNSQWRWLEWKARRTQTREFVRGLDDSSTLLYKLCSYLEAFAKHDQTTFSPYWSVETRHSIFPRFRLTMSSLSHKLVRLPSNLPQPCVSVFLI
jgi:hypothetical protein